MPVTTNREETEYALPEDTLFPGILASVSTRTINYNDKKTGEAKSFDKWEWVFEISEGEYSGLNGYGETESYMSTRDDNKVRQWAETLRDMPFEIGDGLDTDELVGLPCMFTVLHEEPRPKKDGSGMWYSCKVKDLFPEGTTQKQADEPPF